MPSRTEQRQAFCNRCGELTLHSRNVAEFNHTPHILASVFLCGVWLPVWLLLAFLHEGKPKETPRCTRCGQAIGQRTREQEAAARAAERARTAKMFEHLPKPAATKPAPGMPRIVTNPPGVKPPPKPPSAS